VATKTGESVLLAGFPSPQHRRFAGVIVPRRQQSATLAVTLHHFGQPLVCGGSSLAIPVGAVAAAPIAIATMPTASIDSGSTAIRPPPLLAVLDCLVQSHVATSDYVSLWV
jgi:hypothetical protein